VGFVPKQNCWEYKKCGREKSDATEGKPGVCPATYIEGLNGVHCGVNGGRCCWAVSGTFCDGKIQGTFAEKLSDCSECDFYKMVMAEEKQNIMSLYALRQLVRKSSIFF